MSNHERLRNWLTAATASVISLAVGLILGWWSRSNPLAVVSLLALLALALVALWLMWRDAPIDPTSC